jgi:hypothetical protein
MISRADHACDHILEIPCVFVASSFTLSLKVCSKAYADFCLENHKALLIGASKEGTGLRGMWEAESGLGREEREHAHRACRLHPLRLYTQP